MWNTHAKLTEIWFCFGMPMQWFDVACHDLLKMLNNGRFLESYFEA